MSTSREGSRICLLANTMLISYQPSVQKLIDSVAQDALVYLNEESCHTDAFIEPIPGVLQALNALKQEFSSPVVDQSVLEAAAGKSDARVALKYQRYTETV